MEKTRNRAGILLLLVEIADISRFSSTYLETMRVTGRLRVDSYVCGYVLRLPCDLWRPSPMIVAVAAELRACPGMTFD